MEAAYGRLMTAIAAELGDGWTVEEGPRYTAAYLSHRDGRKLCVGRDCSKPTRLSIGGEFPPSNYYFSSGERHFRISVSASRPARSIAGDIRRRFMPHYEPVLEKVRRHLVKTAMLVARRSELAHRIAAGVDDAGLFRGDADRCSSVSYNANDYGQYHADVDHSGESANLRMTGVPGWLAAEIFELIGERLHATQYAR